MLAFRHFANSLVADSLKAVNSAWPKMAALISRERQLQPAVAGPARRLEQRGAHAGKHLPVAVERIDVAVRDAAAQVAVDVLQVLRLGAVDVARQVEVEVVLRVGDLGQRHHAGVARDFDLPGEGVDDLVDVLVAQAVLVAVLDEALGGVDHEDALAGGGVLLVEHDDAGGDAGAVEEVGRQADDALDVAARGRSAGGWRPRHCRGRARRAAGCTAPLPVLFSERRMCSRKA